MRIGDGICDEAPVAAEPYRNGELAAILDVWNKIAAFEEIEPGILHEGCDFFAGKAQPAVGVMFAQTFLCMRREIDDKEPT